MTTSSDEGRVGRDVRVVNVDAIARRRLEPLLSCLSSRSNNELRVNSVRSKFVIQVVANLMQARLNSPLSTVVCLEGFFMRCLVWIVTVSLLGGVLGCGGETDEQRLERLVPGAVNTTPVTGNVTVDGQPVKDLWVTLHPKDPSVPLRPRGQTDERGNFRLTTYTGGDGAPTGEYDITIEWLTFIKRGGDWGGPDKLKNQCNDPKTTPYHVTVQDTPIVLPTFELKLEGVAAKPGKPAAPTSRKRER